MHANDECWLKAVSPHRCDYRNYLVASERQVRSVIGFTGSQRGLLASHAMQIDAPVQTMAHVLRFDGAIDADRLAAAFDQVVAGADVLRTRVLAGDDGLELSLWPEPPAPTSIVALDGDAVDAWCETRAARPLDLAQSAYDSVVLDHGSGEVSWYLAFDHLVTDAASSALVVEATAAVYNGQALSYAGYYDAPQANSDDQPRSGGSAASPTIGHANSLLSRLYRQSDGATATSSRQSVVCADDLTQAVTAALDGPLRVVSPELSIATMLLTATALYVHGVTGERSFNLGMPVSQRTDANRTTIGPYMETRAVPVVVEEGITIAGLHKHVARSMFAVLKAANRGDAVEADFDVVVNVIPRSAPPAFSGVPLTMGWIPPTAIDPSHLLRVQLTGYDQKNLEGDATLAVDLDINHSAADAEHRTRAPGHFLAALTALVTDPDQRVETIELVTGDELEVLHSWERGSSPTGDSTPLAQRLRAALSERDAIAIRDGGNDLTGAELWSWVEAVAAHVANTTAPGDRVMVELDPSPAAVAAIYGVVLAGRSFVPLDPAVPTARRDQLAELAKVALRFGDAASIAALRDGPRLEAGALPADADEAYLLFTSGSTGAPKGVPISQRGLLGYLDFALNAYFNIDGQPVAPLFSSLGFDLTLTTLFGPILAGGSIEMVGSGPQALSEIAKRTSINWIKATPSHLEVLLRLLPADHGIEVAVVGGEAFPSALASKLLADRPTMQVFNEYGPTEAVVGCMIHRAESSELNEGPDIPIGIPAPGVELRIVNAGGARVPIGAIGELVIAHDGVTQGYVSEPSAEFASPFIELDGIRFYRSGDLVRLRDAHRLEYHGRVDTQIKVGGRRLDPLEVEEALVAHPAISRAAVRLWSPTEAAIAHRCVRCGIADNVPGINFDDEGICSTCLAFDSVADVAAEYFGYPEELRELIGSAEGSPQQYDCLHLLSGGKDSTFALYQLVEMGFHPYVLTFDNGFISEGAKDNVRQTVADLGLDHEFATLDTMNDIFRESLAEHSNVCQGCYKAIYTVATNRAAELNIPAIVTGLSRGQLFETRLVPAQFSGESDPEAIDRAVLRARMHYHRTPDAVNRLLDTEVFANDQIFDRIRYVDFYRYVDVELAEMLAYLDERSPWVRPKDTGRSTNCLINIAGIHTHRHEQGYHNYAIPYAWDVRLGHKTRDEAIAELDDDPELEQVTAYLAQVGYVPRARQVLTAWVEPAAGATVPSPMELRSYLRDSLPTWAMPAAIVEVDDWPTNANGKLDDDRLPPPTRVHRGSASLVIAASNEVEMAVVSVWERTLGVEPIGIDDDFFSLGGDSLAALNATSRLASELQRSIPDEFAFMHTTPRELAAAIELAAAEQPVSLSVRPSESETVPRLPADVPPSFSPGEASVLFEQRERPDDIMYNLGRRYRIAGPIDGGAFAQHLRAVVQNQPTLRWSFTTPRHAVADDQLVDVQISESAVHADAADRRATEAHRAPYDLTHGPLLRCLVQPIDDGSTDVMLAMHHAAGDRTSLDALFDKAQRSLFGDPAPAEPFSYYDYWAWKGDRLQTEHEFWMAELGAHREPVVLQLDQTSPEPRDQDGLLSRLAAIPASTFRALRGVTPIATVVGAAGAAVADLFESSKAEVCLLASAREHPDTANQCGYFLNPVPVRLHTTPDRTTLTDLNAQLGRRLAHRSYPFAQLVSSCRDSGIAVPSARILVAWDDGMTPTFAGKPVGAEAMFNGTAVADLTFFAEVVGESVRLSLEYSGSSIGAESAQGYLAEFDRALTELTDIGASAADERAVGEPALILGPEPVARLSLRESFQRHLETGTAAPAVRCGDTQLDWATLAARSHQLAGVLRDHGVGPSSRVVVELPRCTSLVVALMAVMHCGGSYVPIDPTYPAAQRSASRQAAQAGVRIAGSDDDAPGLITVVVNERGVDGRSWLPTRPSELGAAGAWAATDDDDEAYVIFTSGSTGTPRGVAVTHAQINATTAARDDWYDEPPRSFVVPSSAAFDSSLVGLFWTLAHGGAVILPTDDQAHDIDALVGLLDREAPGYLLCVPSLYRALLRRSVPAQGWPGHVIVAGEACDIDVISAHRSHFGDASLTNEYGPTEASVWATAHRCDGTETHTVPIGTPIAGSFVAVVDDDLTLCAAGTPGQLVIGGAGVTAGYVNSPEQTRARFLERLVGGTSVPEGRVFLTGDAAVIESGTVYFLGRVDDQLNVGGRRVEPGEIESVLRSIDGVHEAVVVEVDDRSTDTLLAEVSAEHLAAAMQASATAPDPLVALRDELSRHGARQPSLVALIEAGNGIASIDVATMARPLLPRLLRPRRIEVVAELPRTANGKIDRSVARHVAIRLASSAGATARVNSDATSATAGAGDNRSEIIRTLCNLFATVLRVDSIEPTMSFFDEGGDSLLTLELLAAIEESLGVSLSTSAVFSSTTPAALAEQILHARPGARPVADRGLVIPIHTGGSRPPIFAINNLGTNAEYFRPLAGALGDDQPFYGLGASHQLELYGLVDYDPDRAVTVEGIAATCVANINEIAPEGPVIVTGLCGGAIHAYEVVQQLRGQGREVGAFVVINDWQAPLLESRQLSHSTSENLKRRWNHLRTLRGEYVAIMFGPLKRRIEQVEVDVYRRLRRPLNHRMRVRQYIEESLASMDSYEYLPYGGRVAVIRGKDDPRLVGQEEAGWGDLFSDVRFHTVDAMGLDVLTSDKVVETADIFAKTINQAIADHT